MDNVIPVLLIIIFCLVGVVWGLWVRLGKYRKEISVVEGERDEFAEIGRGLEEYNRKMVEKKEKAKEKIMSLLEKKGKICHKDVTKEISVGRSTAVRYLDELEAEGKMKQIGKVGKSVFYK